MRNRPHITSHVAPVLAALALTLPAAAHAQQVHVYSDGKPFLDVDAGNASRARAPDERKARHRLADRPDALAIAAAHADAFLHCGLDESRYPPGQPPQPGELDYFVKEASYVAVPGGHRIVVVGEYGRGKAMVDTDKLAVVTPQCPAGVRTVFWSPAVERIVFATQQVEQIAFHGSRALWTATYHPAQDLYLVEAGEAGPMHKLLSLPKEKVLDVLVPDKADHIWVLSQTDKLDLRGAGKLLRALSRNSARKMDIFLRKVDLHGKTLEQIEVARGVAAGSANFVRE